MGMGMSQTPSSENMVWEGILLDLVTRISRHTSYHGIHKVKTADQWVVL